MQKYSTALFISLCAVPMLWACGDDDTDPTDAVGGSSGSAQAGSSGSGSGATGGSNAGSGGTAGTASAGAAGADANAGAGGGAGAAGSAGAAGAGGTGGSGGAPSGVGADGYLLAADLTAEVIYAYSLPDLTLTGKIENVLLGNHLGAIALEDGRVVTTDDKAKEIIAIQMDAHGVPAIVDRVSANIGKQAVWACGDSNLQYLAIASQHAGTTTQVANIVKLEDFSVTQFDVSMNEIDGKTEELHTFIAGQPLHLFASVGAEIRAYPLAAVLANGSPSAVSIAVNPGSHGPVVAHQFGRLYISAAAGTGLDGVSFEESPFARAQLIPWDVGTRSTGRNSRPRLSWDGRYVYGAITRAEPAGAENWAEREVDFHAADLQTQTASRVLLTTGIVPKFQLSNRYALLANLTDEGDFAILVDVDASGQGFHDVVARIPLAALSNGPVAGQATTGKESRSSGITPDGKWAFVTHGGDSKISVIDTSTRAVSATITTPTALAGGGYLFAVKPGTAPVDTCTR